MDDAALGVCRARRAGPLRDMRRFCGGFLAVPGRGTGIPERAFPDGSGAGCTVDRRRSAIWLVLSRSGQVQAQYYL